jgi:hypothetical protein
MNFKKGLLFVEFPLGCFYLWFSVVVGSKGDIGIYDFEYKLFE